MKKYIVLVGTFIIGLVLTITCFYFFLNKDDNNELNSKNNLIAIKSNYNTTVKVITDSNLYKKENNSLKKSGTIYKDSIIKLEEIETISEDDEYFKIKNSNYYINYNDVTPSKSINYDTSYKNYIPFDKKLITKKDIDIYYDNKKIVNTSDELEFDIIIDDNDMYYVEFLDKLVGIRKTDIKSTIKATVNKKTTNSIAVLNYHFFYDPNTEECNESICLKKDLFENHLKYFKDNNYYTASVKDLDLWMDKKINLPLNTVLITVDDGALGTDSHLIELLEKYDLKGTLFLITGWWSKDKYKSANLDIQSHGNDIHLENYCSGVSRGAKGLCLSKDELVKDLEKSIKKLDGEHTAFCYPFYLYSDTMISAIKEVGFSLAFTGGERKVTRSDNKYKIPRFIIYNGTTVNDLKKILNS